MSRTTPPGTGSSHGGRCRIQPIASLAIFSQFRQFGSNIDLIAPASFASMLLPLALFFAFQRYFVEGLLAGSVK